MRPKQKRMLTGLALGIVLLSSTGVVFVSMNKTNTGNLNSALEELAQSNIQYFATTNGSNVEIIDFNNKRVVHSAEQTVPLKEWIGGPYYSSNTEFYQVYTSDEQNLAILKVSMPEISVTTFPKPQNIAGVALDSAGVHVLTNTSIERYDYKGEFLESTSLDREYQKITRYNGTDLLFTKDMAYKNEQSTYLAGNVLSIAYDNEHVYILNDFGSGVGTNMLVKMSAKDLYIEDITSFRTGGAILGVSDEAIYIESTEGLSIIDKDTLKEDFISPSPFNK